MNEFLYHSPGQQYDLATRHEHVRQAVAASRASTRRRSARPRPTAASRHRRPVRRPPAAPCRLRAPSVGPGWHDRPHGRSRRRRTVRRPGRELGLLEHARSSRPSRARPPACSSRATPASARRACSTSCCARARAAGAVAVLGHCVDLGAGRPALPAVRRGPDRGGRAGGGTRRGAGLAARRGRRRCAPWPPQRPVLRPRRRPDRAGAGRDDGGERMPLFEAVAGALATPSGRRRARARSPSRTCTGPTRPPATCCASCSPGWSDERLAVVALLPHRRPAPPAPAAAAARRAGPAAAGRAGRPGPASDAERAARVPAGAARGRAAGAHCVDDIRGPLGGQRLLRRGAAGRRAARATALPDGSWPTCCSPASSGSRRRCSRSLGSRRWPAGGCPTRCCAAAGDLPAGRAGGGAARGGRPPRAGRRRHDRYAFRHALLQEAVYGDLLPGERVRLHATYARLLAALPGNDAAADLARHCLAAHDLPGALAASLRAGERASAVLAPAEALGHYEQALQLVAAVPTGAAPRRRRTRGAHAAGRHSGGGRRRAAPRRRARAGGRGGRRRPHATGPPRHARGSPWRSGCTRSTPTTRRSARPQWSGPSSTAPARPPPGSGRRRSRPGSCTGPRSPSSVTWSRRPWQRRARWGWWRPRPTCCCRSPCARARPATSRWPRSGCRRPTASPARRATPSSRCARW